MTNNASKKILLAEDDDAMRVYLERVETDPGRLQDDPQAALAGVIAAADQIAGIRERTGRDAPDVIT